jgi:hypothetical protein
MGGLLHKARWDLGLGPNEQDSDEGSSGTQFRQSDWTARDLHC